MQPHVPHLDESTSANPALSPGPVQDQETLLRIIVEPDHIREGRIQPSAVQLRDLTHRGLSVYRKEYTTKQAVTADIQVLLLRTADAGRRRLEGLASLNTGAVRTLVIHERPVFVVIDTALPNNRSHASIYLASPQVNQSLARELREHLLMLMENIVALEQAFPQG